jgi:hypothetical protein
MFRSFFSTDEMGAGNSILDSVTCAARAGWTRSRGADTVAGELSDMAARFLILLLVSACAVSAGSTADPSLRTVLSRVERYVEGYESALSTLVARERYIQLQPAPGGAGGHIRTLVSDFLFFRLPGRDGPWLGFRDVLDVDGTPIERQGERLRDIVGSPETAESRAMSMARENARFNIGRFMRTVNVPVCVVAWMHPRIRDRFSFTHTGDEEMQGVRAWRIEFREKGHPTIVRSPEGRNV